MQTTYILDACPYLLISDPGMKTYFKIFKKEQFKVVGCNTALITESVT